MVIKFSLSLSPAGKNAEAISEITDYLRDHGIERTDKGLATLSFVAKQDVFETVFQSTIGEAPDPADRSPDAFGAKGPNVEPKYKMPAAIKHYVDQLSIMPTAQHFRGQFDFSL